MDLYQTINIRGPIVSKEKLHNLHVYLGQDGLVNDTTDHIVINRQLDIEYEQAVYCSIFKDCPDVLTQHNYKMPDLAQYYRDIIDGKVHHE